MPECRKCAGEDFAHHATFCPLRAEEAKEKGIPKIESDPSAVALCSYCGEQVTAATFLESHTMNACGGAK